MSLSSVSEQNSGKRSALVYANSLGNSSTLPQQKSNKKRAFTPDLPLTFNQVATNLCQLNNCCSYGGVNGCFLKFFQSNKEDSQSVDFNSAKIAYLECREQVRLKCKEEVSNFIQEKFRESIVERRVSRANGKETFVMKYMLMRNKANQEPIPVCVNAFASAYDTTRYFIEQISQLIKQSPSCHVAEIGIRTYTDDHIHSYNHSETVKMFKDNLQAKTIGMFCEFAFVSTHNTHNHHTFQTIAWSPQHCVHRPKTSSSVLWLFREVWRQSSQPWRDSLADNAKERRVWAVHACVWEFHPAQTCGVV